MGDFEGGGADNLDLSGYTYGQLRDAVFQIVGDDLQAASNYLADLKRRLHERVGTLHVVIAKLRPDWKAKGGEAALEKLDQQLKWMQEFARVTAVNEAAIDDLIKARHKAVAAMRKLDAMPGGPTPPGAKGKPSPSPAPAPPQTGYVDPSTLDWRHPYAVRAATPLYNLLAITNASFPMPPESYDDPGRSVIDGGSGSGSDTAGAAAPRTSGSGIPSGSWTTGGRPGESHVSKTGRGERGPVLRGSPPKAVPPTAGAGTPAVDAGRGVAGPNAGVGVVAPGGTVDHGGASVDRAGFDKGAATSAEPSAGRSFGSGRASSTASPGGKVLGGGTRPVAGTEVGIGGPGDAAPGNGMPPSVGSGAGTNGRRAKKKPGYEQGEPDTFVGGGTANAAGGTIRQPGAPRSFDPPPGMLGSQKHKPTADQQHEAWDIPETAPSPEGFPEELKSFTRKDGARFEVRRVRGSGS